jgi:hypothetical protein
VFVKDACFIVYSYGPDWLDAFPPGRPRPQAQPHRRSVAILDEFIGPKR